MKGYSYYHDVPTTLVVGHCTFERILRKVIPCVRVPLP
jgi:hypothetical protein